MYATHDVKREINVNNVMALAASFDFLASGWYSVETRSTTDSTAVLINSEARSNQPRTKIRTISILLLIKHKADISETKTSKHHCLKLRSECQVLLIPESE